MSLTLTNEEVASVLSARAAYRQYLADAQMNYEIAKAQCLADGMVEVEPYHFVRPGEPYRDEQGVFHKNPAP
jgi:hypothetical protein